VDSPTNSDCAMVVLSKPITDSFSGTASLTERPAESMPNADASFAAKTALGGPPRLKEFEGDGMRCGLGVVAVDDDCLPGEPVLSHGGEHQRPHSCEMTGIDGEPTGAPRSGGCT
jgi:hypothetical protein